MIIKLQPENEQDLFLGCAVIDFSTLGEADSEQKYKR